MNRPDTGAARPFTPLSLSHILTITALSPFPVPLRSSLCLWCRSDDYLFSRNLASPYPTDSSLCRSVCFLSSASYTLAWDARNQSSSFHMHSLHSANHVDHFFVPAVAVVRLGIARSLSSGEDCTRRSMRPPSQLHRVIAFLFYFLISSSSSRSRAFLPSPPLLPFYRQFRPVSTRS